ncbi:MAG: tetratricopeptide repeat protein [Acidobacteria bacterium]|nr:tetratricopeptide repeat protein [Acidobacteriota bacterium]
MSNEQTLVEEIFDPFNPPEPGAEEELQALQTTLTLAKGFSLLLAKCNQPKQRAHLIAAIKTALPQFHIQEIHFNQPIHHLLDELRGKIADPPPQAVFVSGLEYSLPVAAKADKTPVVANLNASRNSFSKVVRCPLVLWVPEYVLTAIIQGAPDFFSVRSGVFFFTPKIEDTRSLAHSLMRGDVNANFNLTYDEKLERIQTIKGLLADYKKFPDERREYHSEFGLHIRLGLLYASLGDYSSAQDHLQQAIYIAQRLNDDGLESSALDALASLYTDQGRWEEAEYISQKALELSRKIGNQILEANILNSLGNIYFQQGKEAEAESAYCRSLKLFRQNSDRVGEAYTLGNLAMIRSDQENWPEAEKLFQQSLEIYRQFGDRINEGRTLDALGLTYYGQGRLEEAEAIHQQSLRIFEETGNLVEQGLALKYLAMLHFDNGDIKQALALAEQAVAILEKTENERRLIEAKEVLEEIKMQRSQLEASIQ